MFRFKQSSTGLYPLVKIGKSNCEERNKYSPDRYCSKVKFIIRSRDIGLYAFYLKLENRAFIVSFHAFLL
jgi:hypothetical protein